MKSISPRTALALAIAMVAAHLVAAGVLAATVPWTPDERGYFLSGRNLLLGVPWEVPEQRFQGPLGLLANQLFVDGASADPESLDGVRTSARLGMLVFPLLLMTVVGIWARELWGARGALLALFLAATNPTLLAYGPLLAVDVALAATATATFWMMWRWLRAPSLQRLLGFGVAIGLMLATKYTSLLLAAAVPLATALAVWSGADPTPTRFRRADAGLPRRAAAGVTTLALAGVVALLVLNASYLFQAPLYDTAQVSELTSGALRAVTAIPGGALLLGLLPEPFVLGADYQATVARDFAGTFAAVDGSHWAYYPASLLTKTPLGTLGLWVLAMIAPGARSPRVPRLGGLCLGTPAIVLLVYLAIASALQMGIRYLLPLIPLVIVRAGAWAAAPSAARPWGRIVTALACASSLAAAVTAWPHHIGYFNTLVGGPAGGFRLFADGNCDWGQRFDAGWNAIASRRDDAEPLRPGDDPRFGAAIAGYALDLKPPDPARPGHVYHWLTRFPVIDHDSAAWLVFRAMPEDYEDAIQAGDARAARDLALAELRERDFAAARAALDRAPADDRTARLLRVVDKAERLAAGDRSERPAVVDGLADLGHEELALSFLGEPTRDELPRWFLLAVAAGRLPGAIERLWTVVGADDARPVEVLMLAQGLFWQARQIEALEVLEQHGPPSDGDPLLPKWQKFLEEVRTAVHAIEKLKGPPPVNNR